MGSIIISYPDIPEADLVFDAAETREILKFFWPARSVSIDTLEVTTDTRRFAQTLLIAAVDASYAMGFIDILTKLLVRPNRDIRALVQKLARKYVKHWWKHATQHDLLNAKIYDSVRNAIAVKQADGLRQRLNGLVSLRHTLAPFHIVRSTIHSLVWG